MKYNFRNAPLTVHHVLTEIANDQSNISAEEQICWREYQRYLRSLVPQTDYPLDEFANDEFDWEDWEREEFEYYAGIDELGYSSEDRAEEIQHMLDYFEANPNPAYPVVDTADVDSAVEYTKDFRAGNRYLKTQRHKAHVQRNAAIVFNGYTKRAQEDEHNFSFCLKRGGRPVKMPKSRQEKAFRLLVQMDRKNLIPSAHHDQVVELLTNGKTLRKILNTDRGHCDAFIRKLDTDAKARFEHECLMANIEKALAS